MLLTGETGTGKDLAAKAVHYNSGRAARPFVNITCSALPEQLLESELFGHERGAFTDARQQKRGLFETADGGTVFLDEIGEMTPALQAKLLRFLEEKTFKRVGGLADIRVDVRVDRRDEPRPRGGGQGGQVPRGPLLSAAGHADRASAAARAARRRPAAWRTTTSSASTASSGSGCADCRRRPRRCSSSITWPGNVRELRNAIERAMLLVDRESLEPARLHDADAAASAPTQFQAAARGRQPRRGRAPAARAGARARRRQPDAGGQLLGINRDQVRYRLEKCGMKS